MISARRSTKIWSRGERLAEAASRKPLARSLSCATVFPVNALMDVLPLSATQKCADWRVCRRTCSCAHAAGQAGGGPRPASQAATILFPEPGSPVRTKYRTAEASSHLVTVGRSHTRPVKPSMRALRRLGIDGLMLTRSQSRGMPTILAGLSHGDALDP